MREAYSHEVISHGFWPGNDALPEPAFYAYAAPEPAGFKEARIEPAGCLLLPRDGRVPAAVRGGADIADPDSALTRFVETTYAAGARLGGWDVQVLENPAV